MCVILFNYDVSQHVYLHTCEGSVNVKIKSYLKVESKI